MLPIAEIAQDCGFSSLRYFHECFLHHFFRTPGNIANNIMYENIEMEPSTPEQAVFYSACFGNPQIFR